MISLSLDEHQLRLCLGAARAVVLADGRVEEHERRLLTAGMQAIGYVHDLDTLPTVTPAELAAALPDPTTRSRLIQLQLVLAMMDGEPNEAELACIRSFAEALNVDEPRLCNLQNLLRGHQLLVKFDLSRRLGWFNEEVRATWKQQGLGGVFKMLTPFGPFPTLAVDQDIAWKYRQLGMLPEGTLGRAYWTHMTANRFPFPGEYKAFPEQAVKHDLCHVIGGYPTTPTGECEVVSFISGFNRADPFGYLFMIIAHMHLGIDIFEGTPLGKMAFEPERALAAFERGMRVNHDFYGAGWDFWPDMPLPLEVVRQKYNVQ